MTIYDNSFQNLLFLRLSQISEFGRLQLSQEMQSSHLTCCPKVPSASAVGFSLLRHVSYSIPKSCDLKMKCCKHYVSLLYISYNFTGFPVRIENEECDWCVSGTVQVHITFPSYLLGLICCLCMYQGMDSYFPKLCNSIFLVRLQYILKLVRQISQQPLFISTHQ